MGSISKQLKGSSVAPTLRLTITPKAFDVENNQTPVDFSFTLERPSAISSSVEKNYFITIGTKTFSGKATIGGSGTKTIKSGSVVIKHNSDGSKIINYSFSMDVEITWNGEYNGNISASGNEKLPTIPRATEPKLSQEGVTMGYDVTISMPRASSKFTHTLKFKWGNHYEVIGENLGVSKVWNVPLDLANYIPNATKSVGQVICYTYNAGTLIGYKLVDLALLVPTSAVPSISKIEALEGGDVTLGVLVQSQSKLAVTINSSGVYGSSIKSVTSTLDGITYKGAEFVTEPLYFSGDKPLKVTVKDSRGRTKTVNETISVLEYKEPQINSFNGFRCNADGTPNASGKNVKLEFNYKITSLNSLNTKNILIEYKETNGAYKPLQTLTEYEANSSLVTGAVFDVDKSYEIRLVIKDSFYIANLTVQIPTDSVIWSIHPTGDGFALGKISETKGLFDVNYNTKFRKDVEFKNDTSWTELVLDAAFQPYNGLAENKPVYRVFGKVVEIRGAVSPKTAFASAFRPVTILTLPEAIRPSSVVYMLCAGANKDTWTLTADNQGVLGVSQYGSSAYGTVGTNARLGFQIVYTLD